MTEKLKHHTQTFNDLESAIPEIAKSEFLDMKDAMQMTSLRSQQIAALYEASNSISTSHSFLEKLIDFLTSNNHSNTYRQIKLQEARSVLDRALKVVEKRETQYRLPKELIASWRKNPTSYSYSYLWTVHSLYYWFRDEGKVSQRPLSICYLNIIDPIEVAFAENSVHKLKAFLDFFENISGGSLPGLEQCIAPYSTEPNMTKLVRTNNGK
jgi:hypothetical protein